MKSLLHESMKIPLWSGEGNKLSVHLAVVQFGAVQSLHVYDFFCYGKQDEVAIFAYGPSIKYVLKFWGVWTPSPCPQIHSTSLLSSSNTSAFGLTSPPCVDVLYGWPLRGKTPSNRWHCQTRRCSMLSHFDKGSDRCSRRDLLRPPRRTGNTGRRQRGGRLVANYLGCQKESRRHFLICGPLLCSASPSSPVSLLARARPPRARYASRMPMTEI